MGGALVLPFDAKPAQEDLEPARDKRPEGVVGIGDGGGHQISTRSTHVPVENISQEAEQR
jgi:hypothetical protein